MTEPWSSRRRWVVLGWVVLSVAVGGVVVGGTFWFANRADDPDSALSAALIASASLVVGAAALALQLLGRTKPVPPPEPERAAPSPDHGEPSPPRDVIFIDQRERLFSGEFAAVVDYVKRLHGRRPEERRVRVDLSAQPTASQMERDGLESRRTTFEHVASALLAGEVRFTTSANPEYLAEALEFLWGGAGHGTVPWYIWPVGAVQHAVRVPVPAPVPVQLPSTVELGGAEHSMAYAAAEAAGAGPGAALPEERASLRLLRFRVSHHLTLLFEDGRPLPMGYVDARLVWARLAPAALAVALQAERPFGDLPVDLGGWLVATRDPREMEDHTPHRP